jgi:hypothetical protein
MRVRTLGAVIALTLIAADPVMAQSSAGVGGLAVPPTHNVGDDIQATLDAGRIPPSSPFSFSPTAPTPGAVKSAAVVAFAPTSVCPPAAKPPRRPGQRAAPARKKAAPVRTVPKGCVAG